MTFLQIFSHVIYDSLYGRDSTRKAFWVVYVLRLIHMSGIYLAQSFACYGKCFSGPRLVSGFGGPNVFYLCFSSHAAHEQRLTNRFVTLPS